MTKAKAIEAIKKAFLFADIDASVLDSFISRDEISISDYKEGEVIYGLNFFKNALGIIAAGEASVNSVRSGSNMLLRRLTRGDVFGAAALFTEDDNYVTKITAVTATTVVFLSAELMEKLIRADNNIARNYIVFLSDRIRYLNRRIEEFTAGSAESRLANYLSSLSSEDGEVIRMPVNLTQLSEMLDIGRASLYRAFDRLERGGMIKKEGKTVTVLQYYALKNFDKSGITY